MTFDETNRMPDSAADADDLPPALREQVRNFRELRERGERVRQQLADVRATARSRTGAVAVTVGAGGVLHRVDLGESARNLPMAKLSAEIMATYRRAAQDVAEQGVEIMTTLVGPESPTLQLIRDAMPDASAQAEEGTVR